jgi:hypothetical protein
MTAFMMGKNLSAANEHRSELVPQNRIRVFVDKISLQKTPKHRRIYGYTSKLTSLAKLLGYSVIFTQLHFKCGVAFGVMLIF